MPVLTCLRATTDSSATRGCKHPPQVAICPRAALHSPGETRAERRSVPTPQRAARSQPPRRSCDSSAHFPQRAPIARSEYWIPNPIPSETILIADAFGQASAAAPFPSAVASIPNLFCTFGLAQLQLSPRGQPKQTNISCGESGSSRRLRRTDWIALTSIRKWVCALADLLLFHTTGSLGRIPSNRLPAGIIQGPTGGSLCKGLASWNVEHHLFRLA